MQDITNVLHSLTSIIITLVMSCSHFVKDLLPKMQENASFSHESDPVENVTIRNQNNLYACN